MLQPEIEREQSSQGGLGFRKQYTRLAHHENSIGTTVHCVISNTHSNNGEWSFNLKHYISTHRFIDFDIIKSYL